MAITKVLWTVGSRTLLCLAFWLLMFAAVCVNGSSECEDSICCSESGQTSITCEQVHLSTLGTTPVCEDGMYFFDTSCYLFETDRVDQPSAKRFCQNRGLHLVYINSNAEQAYLARTAVGSVRVKTDYWIGLTKNGSISTQWLDGTVLPYTNWLAGSNTECAIMWQNREFKWASRNCESLFISICEFDKKGSCDEYRPHEFGSSCYQLVEARGSLSAARSICEPQGHLVYIESAEEQAFLQSVVTNASISSNVWIGLAHDANDLWIWMNGADLPQWAGDAFTSDTGCFRMRRNVDYQWSDRPCNSNHAYICEQDLESYSCGVKTKDFVYSNSSEGSLGKLCYSGEDDTSCSEITNRQTTTCIMSSPILRSSMDGCSVRLGSGWEQNESGIHFSKPVEAAQTILIGHFVEISVRNKSAALGDIGVLEFAYSARVGSVYYETSVSLVCPGKTSTICPEHRQDFSIDFTVSCNYTGQKVVLSARGYDSLSISGLTFQHFSTMKSVQEASTVSSAIVASVVVICVVALVTVLAVVLCCRMRRGSHAKDDYQDNTTSHGNPSYEGTASDSRLPGSAPPPYSPSAGGSQPGVSAGDSESGGIYADISGGDYSPVDDYHAYNLPDVAHQALSPKDAGRKMNDPYPALVKPPDAVGAKRRNRYEDHTPSQSEVSAGRPAVSAPPAPSDSGPYMDLLKGDEEYAAIPSPPADMEPPVIGNHYQALQQERNGEYSEPDPQTTYQGLHSPPNSNPDYVNAERTNEYTTLKR